MKLLAVGEHFVIEIQQTKTNGIVSFSDNIGTVISCNYPNLVGKEVIFRKTNKVQTYRNYSFVEYDDIMAVMS